MGGEIFGKGSRAPTAAPVTITDPLLVPQPPLLPVSELTSNYSAHSPCHIGLVFGPSLLSGNTTEAAMTDLTQKLPVELLAEILGHASAPDILKTKQVRSPSLICGRIN